MKSRKSSLKLKLAVVVCLLLFVFALPVLNSVAAAEGGKTTGHAHNLYPSGFFVDLAGNHTSCMATIEPIAEKLEIPVGDNIGKTWDFSRFFILFCSLVYLLLFIFFLVMIFLMRARGKRAIFIVCLIGWILLGTYVVVQGLKVSKDLAYSVSVAHAQYETEPFQPYALSADQQGVIAEFGNPHGFVILFASQGRQETWFYYDEGLVLDFLGGVEFQRAYDETLIGLSTAKTPYAPHDFAGNMTPGTALSLAELDRFLMEPLQAELVENGTLYFGEGIAMGFIDDGLCYVETFISEDD